MYFVGSFSQIHRRLYSVGRCSVVEWVLSVPSKVRFLDSFWRCRLGSFYQQQKTVKPGPLNGWIKLDSENFLQIEVIHQILWKERSQAGASTMVLDSLCGWVRVRSSSKNQGRQSCCPSRGIRFPSRQSGVVSFLSDRCDEILRLSALRL